MATRLHNTHSCELNIFVNLPPHHQNEVFGAKISENRLNSEISSNPVLNKTVNLTLFMNNWLRGNL